MYLRYGLIADHIAPGHASKKTVIGIFDIIIAQSFPATHKTLSCGSRVHGSKRAPTGSHWS